MPSHLSTEEKASRYDLDRVGIERRAADAVELVELRAKLAREISLVIQSDEHIRGPRYSARRRPNVW